MKWTKIGVWLALFTLSGLPAAGAAAAATYDIDQSHSSVGFRVRHLTVANVRGYFEQFSGAFDYDPAASDAWKVEATIQTASINTKDAKRDEHLRSADFFEVESFPTMTFRSTAVEQGRDGKHLLKGDLTIRDVTKPVVLELEFNGEVNDPWGNKRVGFTATGRINRKDFGLTWSRALETGGLVVGDDVDMTIEIEGIARK